MPRAEYDPISYFPYAQPFNLLNCLFDIKYLSNKELNSTTIIIKLIYIFLMLNQHYKY